MDRQNFEAKDRYPLSTQALTFMQDMVMATARLALIGGDHYILSGCAVSGNNVADGIIVINGEVMPFKGGTVVPTITIVEEVIQVSANGLTFENARTKRYAKFASGTGVNYYPWANFKQLQTNKQLEEAKATVKYVDDAIAGIQAGSIPTGVIVMWGGREADIPKGWCLCDGRTLSDNTRVPDLRGRFIVGYNPAQGSGYQSIVAGSRNADQYKIVLQEVNIPKHKHQFDDYFRFDDSEETLAGVASGKLPMAAVGKLKNDGAISNTMYYRTHDTFEAGRSEAFDIRPPYYVLAFIIKINVKE